LIENRKNINIIHINYNLPEFDEIKNSNELYNYISNKYIENKENYVLNDEIQMCDGFEKVINGLHALEKYDYIKDVFNTLIIRDIKQKYKIRNTDVIQNLTNYLMDNISNLTSINNITKQLNMNNISITDKTINNYVDYLCKV
jgi:predicted AAA+ superfamily ATPase